MCVWTQITARTWCWCQKYSVICTVRSVASQLWAACWTYAVCRHDSAFHLIWQAHTMMYYSGQRWLSYCENSLLQFSMYQTYLCRKLNFIYETTGLLCVPTIVVSIRDGNNNAMSRVVRLCMCWGPFQSTNWLYRFYITD